LAEGGQSRLRFDVAINPFGEMATFKVLGETLILAIPRFQTSFIGSCRKRTIQ
jgi:hypothetical protein